MLIDFNFIEIYASFFYHAILVILSYQNTQTITLVVKENKKLKKKLILINNIYLSVYI